MTKEIAAFRGQSIRTVGAILTASCNRARTPVRANSHRVGTCETSVWKPIARAEVQRILRAAQRYELAGRRPGRRNGPLGHIALEIITLFANVVSFRTGQLDPSLDWVMRKLKRSKDAVVRGLKALRDHGFLHWLRRFQPAQSNERGPQIRQASNAYQLRLPERALALLGKHWASRPALPEDNIQATLERAANQDAYRSTLRLDRLALFELGDNPLGRALATLGKTVQQRESAKRSEYLSNHILCVPHHKEITTA